MFLYKTGSSKNSLIEKPPCYTVEVLAVPITAGACPGLKVFPK